ATSTSISPGSSGRGTTASPTVSCQRLSSRACTTPMLRPARILRAVIRSEVRDHIALVTIDNPPVNALPVAGWFALAEAVRNAGRDPDIRVAIINAEGKGFQCGVDIKELAADPTKETLIGVNRGCYETFAAVYDCEVPVIAAVNGYCLGGGVGIAG